MPYLVEQSMLVIQAQLDVLQKLQPKMEELRRDVDILDANVQTMHTFVTMRSDLADNEGETEEGTQGRDPGTDSWDQVSGSKV
ncbi:hypothetical protein DPSP01_014588 [Paraphaeosphaeria sporulosa]